MQPKAHFFVTPGDFRTWLEHHDQSSKELLVGFHKKGSGKPTLTWPESVDQALCFGWIDGVRRYIDQDSYSIRFTPRKSTSKWSSVNIKRVAEVTALGLMQPAGLKAFEQRTEDKSSVYSYEQRHTINLNDEQESLFRANKKAWAFFEAQPHWYRKTALWWIMTAKRQETQIKRLNQLIADSEQGQPIGSLKRTKAPEHSI